MTGAAEVEGIRLGAILVRFLVEGEATGGGAAVFEVDVAPDGPLPPPHSHDSWEETVYGLRGTLTWTIDGVTTDVGPGEVILIARGVVHSFANHSGEVATQLAIVTPGVLGPGYFRELAALFGGDGPPDRDAILALMARNGFKPAA